MGIPVRVKEIGPGKFGWYGIERRFAGDEFEISDEKHFSEKWMERVGGDKKVSDDEVPAEEPVAAPAVKSKRKK